MYSMAVDKGLDGRLPGTPYSGPATFSAALGGTLIALWADSAATTRLVALFRQTPVTAPGTYKPFSLAQSVAKPDETPTAFVVGEHFTDPKSFLGGSITITAVSETSLTATMNYDDGVHTVDASFNAIRQ
jgi:hypothetical protein